MVTAVETVASENRNVGPSDGVISRYVPRRST